MRFVFLTIEIFNVKVIFDFQRTYDILKTLKKYVRTCSIFEKM